jgi:hypothetical protein
MSTSPANTAPQPSSTAIKPNVGANPYIAQIIPSGSDHEKTTHVEATFEKRDDGYDVHFTIRPINHYTSPAVVDLWMEWIHRIIKGLKFERSGSNWLAESKTCFLKAATLSNRVDEVYAYFECTAEMRNAAYAWAKQHGVSHARSWRYRDEVTVDDCTLSFTLEKWHNNDHVACVQSGIVGKNPRAIRSLSDMLTCINRIGAGETMPSAHETLAKVAIFGDKLTTYRLSNEPTAEHYELAKKYESARMIKYFAANMVKEWTVVHYGSPQTLIKRNNTVYNQTYDGTIASLLTGGLQVDTLLGGPQTWAEILAFANLDDPAPLQRVIAFAKEIELGLDTARIEAAATAGVTTL